MSELRHSFTIYAVGLCHEAPGAGGAAAWLVHPKKSRQVSQGYTLSTPLRLHLLAVKFALALPLAPSNIRIVMRQPAVLDMWTSGWVQKWHADGWRRQNRRTPVTSDLWKEICTLAAKHAIEFSSALDEMDAQWLDSALEIAAAVADSATEPEPGYQRIALAGGLT